MKEIMISIQPQYVADILNGKVVAKILKNISWKIWPTCNRR